MVNGKWKFDIWEENVFFYIDLFDYLECIVDFVEMFRDFVNSVFDMYYFIINVILFEKLNVLMLILIIMFLLMFVIGFFGMNVLILY